MLTSSIGVERNHGKSEQYVEKNHLREPSWKHYVPGIFFYHQRKRNMKVKCVQLFPHRKRTNFHESQIFSKRCVAQFGQDDSNRTDVLVSITEHYENRHCLNKQISKHGMLNDCQIVLHGSRGWRNPEFEPSETSFQVFIHVCIRYTRIPPNLFPLTWIPFLLINVGVQKQRKEILLLFVKQATPNSLLFIKTSKLCGGASKMRRKNLPGDV